MSIYSKFDLQSEHDKNLLGQFTQEIVNYWVNKGYDSDELV